MYLNRAQAWVRSAGFAMLASLAAGCGGAAALTPGGGSAGDSTEGLGAKDPNVPSLPVHSTPTIGTSGFVTFRSGPPNPIIDLVTTLTVPVAPPAKGTLFLWPGLQPGGAKFLPIDNGVLQPVLTWGPSCAPGSQPPDYSTWWVSAQYVNTFGKAPGFTGCLGGTIMSVGVGHQLLMHFRLKKTLWTQTVVNLRTKKTVSFSIDLKGQAQNWAIFDIEGYSSKATVPVVFTNTQFSLTKPEPGACMISTRGPKDVVSAPLVSPNGRHCGVQRIELKN